MKKAFSVIICVLLLFSVASCDTVDKETSGADNAIAVSSENAKFTITIDKTEITGEEEQATVTVKATAKKKMHITLGTGSYKEAGAIYMQCYMEDNGKSYKLYDDQYNVEVTADIYEFTLKKGETIERTLKFARLPIDYKDYPYDFELMPKGEYKLRVRLCDDKDWTETNVVINAQ